MWTMKKWTMKNHRLGVALISFSMALTPGQVPALGQDGMTDTWRLVQRAVEQGGLQGEFESVLEHMQGIESARSTVGNRLSRVLGGLAQPWTPPAMGSELKELLARPVAAGRGGRFEGLHSGLASWLDLKDYAGPGAKAQHPGLQELDALWQQIESPAQTGMALMGTLSDYMELSHTILEEALGGYEGDEVLVLFEGYLDFYEAWYQTHFPGAVASKEGTANINAYKALLRKPRGDRRLILGVAEGLMRLAEPAFQNSLPKRLAKLRGKGGNDILAQVGDAECNRVVLSGRKISTHSEPAALIIDLGGNDRYERAAVVDSPDMLASVVIDLGGDDHYGGEGPGPAFSAAGVALLVDKKGADKYVSGRLGQAASVLGFAALVDWEGDDEYVAEDYGQGHALCGVALLYDVDGDDTYTAWAFAQGGGIGYGLCALVDGAGDDRYLADLHWPDVYGNSGADVYHGASQGYSTGIRSDVAGGIGALIDVGKGKDRYQSGSFSQGGGYYFSFGLMYDGGGDDENFGSRYSQGFGVHQGIGVRWDAGGDDTYSCRSVAHTGMGWDEGVGYLIEDGGDDVYKTGDLSCGGAAQTAIAIHIDRGGSDTYQTGRQAQGGSGGFEYHDKPALGILIDLGGKPDSYSAAERADLSVRVVAGMELFLDLKAKDMRKALKSKLLR
jgi:hypothetical protein